MNEVRKNLCLIEELEVARKLIVSGFEELQEMHIGDDFLHLPQQLLASGFERLMKCYFCLVEEAINGQYPDTNFLKDLGHDLQKLKKTLVGDYFPTNNSPLLSDDLEYLKNDKLLEGIIHVLSEFGQKARYYNLDIITGSEKPPIDPKKEWEELESGIDDPIPYLSSDSMEEYYRDYLPRVNARIIAKLERMARAIAMQFTLGNHGGKLKQMSSTLSQFRNIRNSKFGTIDYRRSVELIKDEWSERCKEDVLSSPWPSMVVSKDRFDEEWPFHHDEVVIECREDLFCVVNIKGYDFALNGSAKSRFNYPYPHDAGIAILGKSVGPFIKLAFSLSSKITDEEEL